MARHDLLLRNPLRLLGQAGQDALAAGELGAILAPAGVGKTALMVQLALNGLLSGQQVLHVSLADPIGKVRLWYDEVLRHIASQYAIGEVDRLWEELLPLRFIMSFSASGFSPALLDERLSELVSQRIFSPRQIVIDGLRLDQGAGESCAALKALGARCGASVWLTVRLPEDAPPGLAAHLDAALQLEAQGGAVQIRALKGRRGAPDAASFGLDPVTMLIRLEGII